MNAQELVIPIIGITLVILVMIFFVALLLNVNSKYRQKHRAELAELGLQKEREIRQAESEATKHTFTEVGRELHDNIGQLLIVVQLGLRNFLENKQEVLKIEESLKMVDKSIAEVQHLGRSLNQDHWTQLNLLEAIEKEIERLNRLSKIEIVLNKKGDIEDPEADLKVLLFRSFQEALTNALKHSKASEIEVSVFNQNGFALSVKDNGKGSSTLEVKQGSGLKNIKRRCEIIDYACSIGDAKSKGFEVILSPLKKGDQ